MLPARLGGWGGGVTGNYKLNAAPEKINESDVQNVASLKIVWYECFC